MGDKRDKLVGALITKIEYKVLNEYCDALGITKSNLIRDLILKELRGE